MSRKRIPRLKRRAVEDDRELTAVPRLPREKAVEDHREVLCDRPAHFLKRANGMPAVWARVRQNPIEFFPQDDSPRRMLNRVEEVGRTLRRERAAELPRIVARDVVQVPPSDTHTSLRRGLRGHRQAAALTQRSRF